MRRTVYAILLFLAAASLPMKAKETETPRIVNIINFIRGVEPRDNGVITPEILYRTVEEQAKCLRKNDLTGTYLLMYNALIEPRYQTLLKEERKRGCEIGGWWEISQPQCEDAGVKWRADVPWLHHANVGFSIGYTQQEREKLVDTYMEKFKEIFGNYPASVGSWFIDAHTLYYMWEKYGIVASCNCRDQVGTDGYTMWGGYWTGGYYPSKKNAYIPAQSKKNQIGVPVFRMLGSDPIYQYDAGLGINVWQSVKTLEPTCTDGGGSEKWVDWYFQTFTEDPALGLTYTQMGQENSFTWARFHPGFEMQATKLAQLRQKGSIRLENLEETGVWFSKRFQVTPASAQSAMSDYSGNNNRTVWFNSRYYRTNVIWEGNRIKLRDVHLFREEYASKYLTTPCTTPNFQYITLPLVDGNLWSTQESLAAMRFYKKVGETLIELQGGQPVLTDKGKTLLVEWPLQNAEGTLALLFVEDKLQVTAPKGLDWCMELRTQPEADLPFTSIQEKQITAQQDKFPYSVMLKKGTVKDLRNEGQGKVMRWEPQGNKIIVEMK